MKTIYEERIQEPLDTVTGPLIGQDLLPAFKAAMLRQRVFQKIFGRKGESIFTDQLPSANDTIIPLLQLTWKSERWQSKNTRLFGVIRGLLVLPADLMGRTDRFRPIAGAFSRWLASRHDLFERVGGLIEIGKNMDFNYEGAVKVDGTTYPAIDITIPCLFDQQLFRLANPEVDLDEPLDAAEIPDMTTYSITITDEDLNTLIPTGVLLETDSEEDEDE